MSQRTLVLGIGNTLLSDEGIGVRVLERVQAELERLGEQNAATRLDHITCLDGGTLSFSLLEPIAECQHLIVIDAARLGAAPGTVTVLNTESLYRHLRAGVMTVHEVSLADLLDMARLTERFPRRLTLVAIEPVDLRVGGNLSHPVQDALNQAVATVLQLLDQPPDP